MYGLSLTTAHCDTICCGPRLVHACVVAIGLPPPPTNIEATQPELDTFLLSWSPSFSPYSVPVTYQVQISSEMGTVVVTTNLTSHLFTPEVKFCSFQVKVSSINAAGQSLAIGISQNLISCESIPITRTSVAALIASLSSVNSSEEVSRSLGHELEYFAENLFVTISFTVSCQMF